MKFIELMKKIGCAKYFAIFQLEELDYTEIMNLVEVDDVDEIRERFHKFFGKSFSNLSNELFYDNVWKLFRFLDIAVEKNSIKSVTYLFYYIYEGLKIDSSDLRKVHDNYDFENKIVSLFFDAVRYNHIKIIEFFASKSNFCSKLILSKIIFLDEKIVNHVFIELDLFNCEYFSDYINSLPKISKINYVINLIKNRDLNN